MNGVIFLELGKYVEDRLGREAWLHLLQVTGIGPKLYLPVAEYPDEEALTLVSAAVDATGIPAAVILEDFGEFIVPDLVKMFGYLLKPQWKTLDIIEQTEQTIHQVLRRATPHARPPALRCVRPSPDEVIITYTSPRKLCAVAEGITRGIANLLGECISITHPICMLQGASKCELSVKLIQAGE